MQCKSADFPRIPATMGISSPSAPFSKAAIGAENPTENPSPCKTPDHNSLVASISPHFAGLPTPACHLRKAAGHESNHLSYWDLNRSCRSSLRCICRGSPANMAHRHRLGNRRTWSHGCGPLGRVDHQSGRDDEHSPRRNHQGNHRFYGLTPGKEAVF